MFEKNNKMRKKYYEGIKYFFCKSEIMEDYLIRLLKQTAMNGVRLADFSDAVGYGVLLLLTLNNKCGVVESIFIV